MTERNTKLTKDQCLQLMGNFIILSFQFHALRVCDSAAPLWSRKGTTGSIQLVAVDVLQFGYQVFEVRSVFGRIAPTGAHDVIDKIWTLGWGGHPVAHGNLLIDFAVAVA